jgi:hypothetical protein
MDSLLAWTNDLHESVNVGYTWTSPAFSPGTFAHYPSHGFDVLFTDGSVQFVQSIPAFNLVVSGQISDGASPAIAPFFNLLEHGQ